jgi:hypothetical protein
VRRAELGAEALGLFGDGLALLGRLAVNELDPLVKTGGNSRKIGFLGAGALGGAGFLGTGLLGAGSLGTCTSGTRHFFFYYRSVSLTDTGGVAKKIEA